MRGKASSNPVRRLLAQTQAVLGEGRVEQRACRAEASALLIDLDARIGPDIVPGGLAAWQLRRVREFIEGHIREPIMVATLAAIARLSPRHFARAFARSQGLPPHAYIIARRIAEAKRLMRATSLPLSEIALACGACDQAHLSRLFRATCGTTPLQWRRAHGGEPACTVGRRSLARASAPSRAS